MFDFGLYTLVWLVLSLELSFFSLLIKLPADLAQIGNELQGVGAATEKVS